MSGRAHRTMARLAAAGALALALAGCSSQSGTSGADWSQIVGMMTDQFGTGPSITLDQAAAVPFASLGVRIADGPEQMVVLASDTSGDQLWTSKAKIAVTTRHGRVVRTAGLPRNIDAVQLHGGDAIPDTALDGLPHETVRYSDFWDLNRYSVTLRCTAVSHGAESVVILGKSIATVRVDESCASTDLDWSFTDSFWVGSSGLVWKSIQHYHPDYDPLEIEVLRPPASPN
jgi:hypothetical protein